MKKIIYIYLMACWLLPGCGDSFLDEKPDQAFLIPDTLDELELLLNNELTLMNRVPALGIIGADSYYLPTDIWASLFSATDRNAYIWAVDIFEGEGAKDWEVSYEQIFYANVVLEGLQQIKKTPLNAEQWDMLQGRALFYRSYAFYSLAAVFAPPYQEETARTALGIPLRRTADINAQPSRATVEETYVQIVDDMNRALQLLPVDEPIPTVPDREAVHAMLARVYLAMAAYGKALEHATQALALNSTLLDFNTLDTTASRPVERFNPEVSYHTTMNSYSILREAFVTPELYALYEEGDLRKVVGFENRGDDRYGFKGFFNGSSTPFGGLTTGEMLLIQAECYARQGETDAGLASLNTLLVKRMRSGAFEQLVMSDATEVLDRTLEERRKELAFRGPRWTDLRRLNSEPQFAVTLTRSIDGITYELPPGDPRYVYPLPEEEVQLSGITQNHRQ